MSITFPTGFLAASTTAGIKPSGKSDLALVIRAGAAGGGEDRGAFAAVLTRNAVVGAPILIARDVRSRVMQGVLPVPRAVLVNAGNSNAATGQAGVEAAQKCMQLVADKIGVLADQVVPSSTGIIGRPLPVDKITTAIPGLVASLAHGGEADGGFARAIMTTDLVPKTAKAQITLSSGRIVKIGAAGKGSGMIAPRLDSWAIPAFGQQPQATMLAFVTTDAWITSADLQRVMNDLGAATFSRISVDNHPSCSDSVLVMASGQAMDGHAHPLDLASADGRTFIAAMREVCQSLAQQIVVDGEGATRIFSVRVVGAPSEDSADRIAREVINSPLVKCAIHGRDPNWGRIVTAAGNAGVWFDPMQASLAIGPVEVYRGGVPVVEALKDPRLAAAMAGKTVACELRIGTGAGEATAIGCDLSKDYVSINADYTT
jgi:glutamate N-acetyltransferase / amino-acid N-acetyltransferase